MIKKSFVAYNFIITRRGGFYKYIINHSDFCFINRTKTKHDIGKDIKSVSYKYNTMSSLQVASTYFIKE
jgi:hypothetical protein